MPFLLSTVRNRLSATQMQEITILAVVFVLSLAERCFLVEDSEKKTIHTFLYIRLIRHQIFIFQDTRLKQIYKTVFADLSGAEDASLHNRRRFSGIMFVH